MPLTMERLNELSLERAQTAPDSFSVKPLAPDNISVTASKRGFRIQWSQVVGVEGYRVAVIDDQDLSEPNILIEVLGDGALEYFYYVGNVAITRFFAVQSFNKDESSDFTTLTSATTTIDVPNLLEADFTASSHTGDTNATDLKSFTMPGGTMGSGDALRITTWGSSSTSANNKTLVISFGAATVSTITTTDADDWSKVIIIGNKNTVSDQTAISNIIHDTNVLATTSSGLTRDTASDVIIKMTVTLANGGETITQLGWMIERVTGDAGESEPPSPPNPPIPPSDPGKPGRDFGTF